MSKGLPGYRFLLRALPTAMLSLFCAVSCTSPTRLRSISDLPLKRIELPDMAWERSPMRAHAQYLLYGAFSDRERRTRLGDYYFIEWYDGNPKSRIRIEMLYTQAATSSRVLSRSIEISSPRRFPGVRRNMFTFCGEDRVRLGDVLTWRINLYVDGKLADTRRSYLWQE